MKTLNVGIVGAAGRGKGFFSAFLSNPITELSALCDINEQELSDTASTVGVQSIYRDYEEMLDKCPLDIVVIGTPMHLHVPQSIMALDRGIHVMSEVPAAVSMEEARELVAACKRSKAKYMMAENYCYTRPNVLVRALADAGLFGDVYYAEGQYIHELKELNEVTKWRRKWQTGVNGCTYPTHSLGPVVQWMKDRVAGVLCVGSGHHYRDPRGDQYEIEDTVTMMCRMERGGLAEIRLDMLSNRPHNMTYYSLQGTEGCYEARRGLGDEPKVWLASRSSTLEWVSLSDLEREFLPDHWLNPPKEALEAGHGGGDYWIIQEFVEAILEDRDPSIGIHEAMDMTLPGLASQDSIAKGSVWVDVPDSRSW